MGTEFSYLLVFGFPALPKLAGGILLLERRFGGIGTTRDLSLVECIL